MVVDNKLLEKYAELMNQASITIDDVIKSLNELKEKLEKKWENKNKNK